MFDSKVYGEAYAGVAAVMSTSPFAFDHENGGGDLITPLLAKFLQITIKVYDWSRSRWETYWPNGYRPTDRWVPMPVEIKLALCPGHYDAFALTKGFMKIDLPADGCGGGFSNELVGPEAWIGVAAMSGLEFSSMPLIERMAKKKKMLTTVKGVVSMGAAGFMTFGLSKDEATAMYHT